jgi:hypothetical protein
MIASIPQVWQRQTKVWQRVTSPAVVGKATKKREIRQPTLTAKGHRADGRRRRPGPKEKDMGMMKTTPEIIDALRKKFGRTPTTEEVEVERKRLMKLWYEDMASAMTVPDADE